MCRFGLFVRRDGWRAMLFALFLNAPCVFASPDAITIGNASAPQGGNAWVPVYVRDAKGTTLGVENPAKIRGFQFTVGFDPVTVSGCTSNSQECDVGFVPSGVLRDLKPTSSTLLTTGDTVVVRYRYGVAIPNAELAKTAAKIQSPDRVFDFASRIGVAGPLDESGPEIVEHLARRGFLSEAVKVAELVPDAARRSRILRDVVIDRVGKPDETPEELANAEAINNAQQIAEKITDPAAHDEAVYAIAVQMIRTSPDRGVRYAREMLFRDEKRADLLLLAAAKTAGRDQAAARGFATTANQYVVRVKDDRTKSRLLADVAIVFATLGDFDSGRNTAAQCAIQADRLRAYAGLLEATLTSAPRRTTKPAVLRPEGARSA